MPILPHEWLLMGACIVMALIVIALNVWGQSRARRKANRLPPWRVPGP